MRIAPKLIIVAALGWLFVIIFLQAKHDWALEPDDPARDPTKIMMLFLAMIAIGIGMGVVFAGTILPAFGEQVGHFFFTPNQQIEKGPHADALSLLNQGEYEGAVIAYRRAVDKNPLDTHAISEVARLLCERLGRPEDAAEYLASHLEGDRPMDEVAFIAERLVDCYWNFLQDEERALPVLHQLAEKMPDTKHSANANHRIREIEMTVYARNVAAANQQSVEAPSAGDAADSVVQAQSSEDGETPPGEV